MNYGNTFVAVGNLGTILTSTDATNWTTRASGTPNQLSGVNYGDGIIVAVGKGGVIVTSPDGTTWTSRNSGTTKDVELIQYINGAFVALTSAGTLLSSPNGTPWNSRNSATAQQINGLAYANGIYVGVGSRNGTNQTIETSVNATNWIVQVQASAPEGLYKVAYGNGTFITVGYNGTILQSGNTNLQVIQPYFSEGLFVCSVTNGVGQRSIIQESTNLTTWVNVLTNNATSDLLPFQDTTAIHFQQRYYRAEVP